MIPKNLFQESNISPENQIWNSFISLIVMHEFNDLTDSQKDSALAFYYDSEVNNGGHSAYFDSYPDIPPQTVADALKKIGAEYFSGIFFNAYMYGENDDYVTVDDLFGNHTPNLTTILREYVFAHAREIGLLQEGK